MKTYHRNASIVPAQDLALAIHELDAPTKAKIGVKDLDLPGILGALMDGGRGAQILNELGITGAYYVKDYGGKSYVILKGHAGLRGYLKGTKYLATNPKVVQLGLGPAGALSAMKANFILSMTVYTTADVVAYLAGDGMTLSQLASNAIFNGASTALSSLASVAAAAGIGMITTMALPGIAGGIVAGVAVSVLLNNANSRYQLAASLAEFLDKVAAAFSAGQLPANTPVSAKRHDADGSNLSIPAVPSPAPGGMPGSGTPAVPGPAAPAAPTQPKDPATPQPDEPGPAPAQPEPDDRSHDYRDDDYRDNYRDEDYHGDNGPYVEVEVSIDDQGGDSMIIVERDIDSGGTKSVSATELENEDFVVQGSNNGSGP